MKDARAGIENEKMKCKACTIATGVYLAYRASIMSLLAADDWRSLWSKPATEALFLTFSSSSSRSEP